MRILFVFICCLSFSFLNAQSGQNFWQTANEDLISVNSNDRYIIPNNYYTASLDTDALADYLRSAPEEYTPEVKDNPLLLEIPMPDGRLVTFSVYYSPVMMPGLAAKYPQIKSYGGYSVSEKGIRLRFSLSQIGFHASFNSSQYGKVYIDPYANNQTEHYISYFTKDHHPDLPFEEQTCGFDDISENQEMVEAMNLEKADKENTTASTRDAGELVDLRTYRFAMGCTGEWGDNFDTVADAQAMLVNGVNRLNEIFEIDIAIRLLLIDNNDELIFLDEGTDPWTIDTGNGGAIIGVNTFIYNTIIGSENYDFGHVINGSCNVGGVAFLQGVCGGNKAGGVTCTNASGGNFINVVAGTTAHELGHSLGATHTWNFCGSPDNENITTSTAYEPGDGNTIMSYNGLCGNPNATSGNMDYYHVASLEQIRDFTFTGNGNFCATTTQTGNHYPDMTLPYEDGFYIPISTPFVLSADATDEDDDLLTFTWEQFNLSPLHTQMGSPLEDEPSFRSFFPEATPTRVFPKMQNVVTNQDLAEEVLPTYSRNLNFRCTVRDNNPEISGVIWEEVAFKATAEAGPFLVTYPNSSIEWEVGDYVEVTWDVANTDGNLVNCQSVNISLSTDGGYNYPITLAENIPNNGSFFIMVPDNITTTARVRIEAADNIFFDISNTNFQIVSPSEAGYAFTATPFAQQICLPDAAIVDLPILSLLGYNDPISFELVGLPPGATASYSNNPTNPADGDQTLTIDMSAVTVTGDYELTITGTALDADTLIRNVNLTIVSNDFSDLVLTAPANGDQGVSELPTLVWDVSPYALYYEVQIATNPSFSSSSLADEATQVVDGEYTPSIVLEKSTPYFWRVRPVNECGPGPYTAISAFHTEVLACADAASVNVPINIPGQSTTTISSIINIPSGGVISDLNVSRIKGTYNLVKHIEAKLISPEATEVILFSGICPGSNTQIFNLSLDDQSPNGVSCPPIGGPFLTDNSTNLSTFNGEMAAGIWTLEIRVLSFDGEGGSLDEWELEICSNSSPNAPILVNNNTLAVPPGMENWILNDKLLCEDTNNGPEDLDFTVVNPPQNGDLYYNGNPMQQGGIFRQITINAGNLTYVHNGGPETTDSFDFTVSDGEGGWIPMTTFDIVIDENATVNTTEIGFDNELLVYPNPAKDVLFVELVEPFTGTINTRLYNIQGQVVNQKLKTNSSETLSFDTSGLPAGLYIVEMELNGHRLTSKVAVY